MAFTEQSVLSTEHSVVSTEPPVLSTKLFVVSTQLPVASGKSSYARYILPNNMELIRASEVSVFLILFGH